MTYFIVYTSKSRNAITRELLLEIASKSKVYNQAQQITGMLLGTGNKFIQYLEGPKEELIGLYEKIKQDGRHYEITTWLEGEQKTRVFSNWSMGAWLLSARELEKVSGIRQLNQFLERKEEHIPPAKFLLMMQNLLSSWLDREKSLAGSLRN